MSATQRRNATGVIEQLLREPQQFNFFQAVRLLDRWMAPSAPDGQGLSKINFRNSLSLSFPASEIESLKVHKKRFTERCDDAGKERQIDGGTGTRLDQLLNEVAQQSIPAHPSEIDRIDITPAFMGLLGVNGTLPLSYTEEFAHRELYQKDYAARAFVDVFSHRAVSLFYQAWRKHRLSIQYESDTQNRFLPLALSLAGLGQKGLRDRLGGERGAVADEALAYYAGTLQQRTLSARQLQQILQDYLAVPVRIEQFVGRWYQVPESGRAYLGVLGRQGGMSGPLNGVLGRSAMLGERVWQRDLRMRVVLGPLPHARFRRFLPGGAGASALKELLTMLSGVSLEYEINLQLQRDDVQGCALDSSRAPTAFRLGWDTFLQTQSANEDRADVRYDIHAAA
ncbi:MAG: type VI secretion system baseplate subunit TssG [Aquabacterium sp.]|uniref:type VI secretion system baseplate subunit TssG n=1 Tax=Aquabacterium sp. TaxID=1872578 RepID=UPI0025BA7E62|nr:type VI secretion system baseplate subunit TssG [Aquabacterium sp.]MBI3384329.1 type VI secretion system baseplate subunit TssG [Aquabacterium sp.]